MGSRLILTAVAGTLISALLMLMPIVFPLTGAAGPDLVAAIGRFHILMLHFPIALLLMVPVFEVIGLFDSAAYLKRAARVLLIFAVFFAAIACVLGYLLAYGEGDTGELLDKHMWAGITTTILMFLSLILRDANQKPTDVAYWVVLLAGIFTLTTGSHHGASLVHGENYLYAKLPPSLQAIIRGEGKTAKKVSFDSSAYEVLIKPIFENNCYVCHSGARIKGGFRMDDYELLLYGGESGMEGIVPGDLEASEVHYRISLDPKTEDIMPPEGHSPLVEEQIALVTWWIMHGASETNSVRALTERDYPEPVRKSVTAIIGVEQP